jgi:PD-(D/E)XK nuclease superfamily
MALGASRVDVLRLVLLQGLWITGIRRHTERPSGNVRADWAGSCGNRDLWSRGLSNPNFLTECICDFLDRVTAFDRHASELFISEILGGSKMPADLLTAISKATILQWKTQQTISLASNRGFVDLCLLADNNLVLIIENKINAGFTTHRVIETEEEPSKDGDENWNQLEFYEMRPHLKRSRYSAFSSLLLTRTPGRSCCFKQTFRRTFGHTLPISRKT